MKRGGWAKRREFDVVHLGDERSLRVHHQMDHMEEGEPGTGRNHWSCLTPEFFVVLENPIYLCTLRGMKDRVIELLERGFLHYHLVYKSVALFVTGSILVLVARVVFGQQVEQSKAPAVFAGIQEAFVSAFTPVLNIITWVVIGGLLYYAVQLYVIEKESCPCSDCKYRRRRRG